MFLLFLIFFFLNAKETKRTENDKNNINCFNINDKYDIKQNEDGTKTLQINSEGMMCDCDAEGFTYKFNISERYDDYKKSFE